jgi:hypothetical protein
VRWSWVGGPSRSRCSFNRQLPIAQCPCVPLLLPWLRCLRGESPMLQQHVLRSSVWVYVCAYPALPSCACLACILRRLIDGAPNSTMVPPTPTPLTPKNPSACHVRTPLSGITMGSLQSGVLGFGIFKTLQAVGATAFAGLSVAENVSSVTSVTLVHDHCHCCRNSLAHHILPLLAGYHSDRRCSLRHDAPCGE